MAAATVNQTKKTSRKRTVHMPSKQNINLAGVKESKVKLYVLIPVIILILVAAALSSKFAVIDRYQAVSAAQGRVLLLRAELASEKAKLSGFSELQETYAHYTYSGMTDEELNRVDRSDAIYLIQNVVIPNVVLDSWSISANQLSMNITGDSLQTINLLVQKLNEEPIVDFCTVRSASTSEYSYQETESGSYIETVVDVSAQVTVYLTAVEEG